jgi:hypothetical protein
VKSEVRRAVLRSDQWQGRIEPAHVLECLTGTDVAYGQMEYRIEGNQDVLDVVRRTTLEKVTDSHLHSRNDDSYVWGGIELGRLDTVRATAAGI